ncbi:MAG: hypothetical protein QM750_14210 [Rubrivivax sp.]
MSNYRSQPLSVCASATGGADVDVSVTLFIDGSTTQEGDATLTDVHLLRACADLRGRKTSGEATLRLIFLVVPLAGNGQFEVRLEIGHSSFPQSPVVLVRKGDVGDGPKTFKKTFKLP